MDIESKIVVISDHGEVLLDGTCAWGYCSGVEHLTAHTVLGRVGDVTCALCSLYTQLTPLQSSVSLDCQSAIY